MLAVGAVTVPLSVDVPVTDRLPTVIAPETPNDVNVPTEEMLGCAAVDKVPVRVVAVTVVPLTLPPEIFPVTANDVNVPTEVMLG